jgi:hypothetical protein
MLMLIGGIAVAMLALGAISKHVPNFQACRPEAGRPTERDLAAMRKRFYYPSTRMLAFAALLGSAWYLMRALGYQGIAREICGTWSAGIAVLAVVVKFFENCFDLVAGFFGTGPMYREYLKAHARIESFEKGHGYAPAKFIGRMGFDVFGAFWERIDGSRNRAV